MNREKNFLTETYKTVNISENRIDQMPFSMRLTIFKLYKFINIVKTLIKKCI